MPAKKYRLIPLFALILGLLVIFAFIYIKNGGQETGVQILENETSRRTDDLNVGEAPEQVIHPLSIEYLRQGDYPGSDLVIEQELSPGSNYERYIVSYKSEGLKIYALLTVPFGDTPEKGWPVIVFNHGYIPPEQYRTTERYAAYTDAFSRNGYILLRPDYRGHGNSEGDAEGGYGSNAYTIDVLNAVASIKMYEDADPNRIGMWGHSMGGPITLENMVVSDDVKAGVIWAGVVGDYNDIFERWRKRMERWDQDHDHDDRRSWREDLIERYGEPSENSEFWNSLTANAYLSDISGPVQLHHGTNDSSVPFEFSEKLNQQMLEANQKVEIFLYEGDDHNISQNLNTALQRSVDFFDTYVK